MKRLLAALAAAAFLSPALAQQWPAKPVRVIVNVAPGGVADITARVLGARLTETLGQPFDVRTYYPDGAAVRTGRFAGTGITPRPEYAKLAEAYGGYGEKVERPQEVRAALHRAREHMEKGRLALLHMVLE